MLGVTHYHNDRTEEKRYRLRWPEFDGIKILLETGLLAHLVLVATPTLLEQIAVVNPGIVPEPFTTILHSVLWLGVGAVVVWVLRSESLVSTNRFADRDVLAKRLERDTAERREVLVYVGAVTAGAALCWASYERFVATVLNLVDLLIIVVEAFEWSITVADGLFSVGFLAGFLLFAYGFDRLVVVGLRRAIRWQYDASWE
jgi:hypothetical protein